MNMIVHQVGLMIFQFQQQVSTILGSFYQIMIALSNSIINYQKVMQELQENQVDSHPEPQIITIDEKWIVKNPYINIQLLTCPICYSIPLTFPQQCSFCERIFCRHDYEIIVNNQNRCPNCKNQPWSIKKDIHISYKHMFDSLFLECQYCTENEQQKKVYNKKEIVIHLEQVHNKYLSGESILYDYILVNQKGKQLCLNQIQNVEINYKRNLGHQKYEIAGLSGRVLSIDLNEMSLIHHHLGKCKILTKISSSIKKNYQYQIWVVNINDQQDNEERIVFYSEQFQAIINKNYKDFEKNERLNQFCLDVRESRFRMSFSDMTQINTYTKSQKMIHRINVTFR